MFATPRRQPPARGPTAIGLLLAVIVLAGPAAGQALVWDVAGRCWRSVDGEPCRRNWNSAARAYAATARSTPVTQPSEPAERPSAKAPSPAGPADDAATAEALRALQDVTAGESGELNTAEVEALVESLREGGAPVDLLSGVDGGAE